ncbi:MAG: site-specific integrase [Weeksellaceae bacterium]|nr:site-specific integrase [Weeksellaceae bacterium]
MKISILFLLRRSKTNNKGLCPIECRITFDKKRKPFSTGIFINPENWNPSKQKAFPPSTDHDQINTQLSLIKQEINQAFLMLQVQPEIFDVEDIYLKYNGEDVKTKKTLLEVYSLHNERMKKLMGIDYSESTYKKFEESKNHVKSFIKDSTQKSNILLEKLNIKFLHDFDYYLKLEKKLKQVTINKHIERLRKIIKLALAEGFLDRDPFLLFSPKKVITEVVFLDTAELKILENHRFKQERLQKVADLFIFCCYSGLPYLEMASLKRENVIIGFDGKKWIQIYRQKTKKTLTIPLLKKAENILNKYESENTFLPIISNQQFNSFLKEIAAVLGIEKRITHHTARKTFASTVLLYNEIPMETVSELLGHSNMKITQEHYAKVVQQKVSEQMIKLSLKPN